MKASHLRPSRAWMMCGSAFFALAFAWTPASAQTATDVAATDSSSNEIVVTARKRGESLADVPVSVTAFDAQTLEDRNMRDLRGLAQQTPGLVFQQLTSASFVMLRGVGASVDSGIAEPSVATYIDGVLLPRATMGQLRQEDLERIEVLRGPQGTLYGRNSSGGAINLISQAPTREFSGGASLGLGNYDLRSISAHLSGPLTSGVYGRISMASEEDAGFYDNIFTGESDLNVDMFNGRGALRFEPSPTLSIDLSVQYQQNAGRNGIQQTFSITNPAAFPPGTVITTEPWETAGEGPSWNNNETWIYSAIVDWQMSENLTLRSITGRVDHESAFGLDAEATSYGLFDIAEFSRPSESFSQEFNLIGTAGPLEYVLGAYYFHEDFSTEQNNVFPNGVGAMPPGGNTTAMTEQEIESYALFVDGSLSITETMRINFGVRYNDETLDVLHTSGSRPPGAIGAPIDPGVNFTGIVNVPGQLSSSEWLPKLGVEFDLGENTLLYALYQRGYKSGGANPGLPAGNFQPEMLDSYEIGVKTSSDDRRIVFAGALYHYEYNGLQALLILPPGTSSSVANADAEITGAEAELILRPTDSVEINLGGAYTDAEYTQFSTADPYRPGLGSIDMAGNRLMRVPEYTLNAGINWTVPVNVGPFSEVVLRGEAYHSGEIFFRPFNLPEDRQEAFTKTNAYLTLNSNEGDLSLRFYVTNIGNEATRQSSNYSGTLGQFFGLYDPPRRYGVRLSHSF